MIETLIFAFLQWGASNPDAVALGASKVFGQPRTVDTSQFSGFADMSQQILKCYHPSARFQTADIVESPWARQHQYNSTKSSLIAIHFTGITNAKYVMQVGLVEREGAIKATVVQETAKMRASSKCALEKWTPINAGRDVPSKKP
jgi:hypothetical protein